MVDTHCHLLPGLDDGPRSTAESMELAHELWEVGVRSVLCTPHYTRQWAPTHAEALEAHVKLREALDAEGLALATTVAAEIGTVFAVTAPIEELVERRIGRYVVVEIFSDTPAQFLETVVDRLSEVELLPVFAHPELARFVDRHPEVLDNARARGGLVQVLAPGIVGFWGPEVAANAWDLLDADRVDLVASDAHGRRRPARHLGRAADDIEKRFGSDARVELTERRPAELLAGREAIST
ncbi:MAG TPA: CpsB/CapC family capsule biosynthesis tyrosine phosphatase [Gaiellaceae bacterium]|jgi:protein-tyrosine phosphatase